MCAIIATTREKIHVLCSPGGIIFTRIAQVLQHGRRRATTRGLHIASNVSFVIRDLTRREQKAWVASIIVGVESLATTSSHSSPPTSLQRARCRACASCNQRARISVCSKRQNCPLTSSPTIYSIRARSSTRLVAAHLYKMSPERIA